MGDEKDFYTAITPIFRALFNDYQGPITASLTAPQVSGWDSLAQVSLVVMVEKHFKVRLAATEVANLKNLGDLATVVDKKLKQTR